MQFNKLLCNWPCGFRSGHTRAGRGRGEEEGMREGEGNERPWEEEGKRGEGRRTKRKVKTKGKGGECLSKIELNMIEKKGNL